MLLGDRSASSAQRDARLKARTVRSIAALARLDPGRFSSHLAAAQLAEMVQDYEVARDSFQQGLELARQQRSDYFVAMCGSRVVKMLLLMPDTCETEEALGQVRQGGWAGPARGSFGSARRAQAPHTAELAGKPALSAACARSAGTNAV